MAEMIAQLLATDAARVKLGARGISTAEAEQLPRNRHATARNPRGSGQEGERLLLIGQTDGGASAYLGDRANRRADDVVDRHRLDRNRPRA
jgi:hypothetical protein